MKYFKTDMSQKWHQFDNGEKWNEASTGKYRTVKYSVIANSKVDIYASENQNMEKATLVASSDGQFEVEVSFMGELWFKVVNADDPDVRVMIRGYAPTQSVGESDKPSVTKPAPLQRRNSDLDKIMHVAALNERRRQRENQEFQQQILDQLKLKDKVEPALIEPDDDPEKPEPKPKQKPVKPKAEPEGDDDVSEK